MRRVPDRHGGMYLRLRVFDMTIGICEHDRCPREVEFACAFGHVFSSFAEAGPIHKMLLCDYHMKRSRGLWPIEEIAMMRPVSVETLERVLQEQIDKASP